MELLTKEVIKELLNAGTAPCLSLYMPTHRTHPENLQDPIRFKNLVRQVMVLPKEKMPTLTGLAAIFRY